MKRLIKSYLLVVLTLGVSSTAWGAVSATDNEIAIQQSGNTFKLTVDQVGYGNKLCGTISSNLCASDWVVTGTTLTINIDQIGNSNQLLGPTILDSSNIDMVFTGNSNIWNWNIGAQGSSDTMDMDVAITGSSTNMDLDIGEPTYQILIMLWDKLSIGGIIICDEYGFHGWDETIGIDNFLKQLDKNTYEIENTNILAIRIITLITM